VRATHTHRAKLSPPRHKSKLDRAFLTDLQLVRQRIDAPPTAPMPHTARSVARGWADRRRVKAQQIAMARAADQQAAARFVGCVRRLRPHERCCVSFSKNKKKNILYFLI
jgi:hypothetical protein